MIEHTVILNFDDEDNLVPVPPDFTVCGRTYRILVDDDDDYCDYDANMSDEDSSDVSDFSDSSDLSDDEDSENSDCEDSNTSDFYPRTLSLDATPYNLPQHIWWILSGPTDFSASAVVGEGPKCSLNNVDSRLINDH